jgi:hypothetical protein
MHAARNVIVVAVLAAGAAACAELPAPGVCGNGVHEPEHGEDCDGDSATCAECRLLCSAEPCPDGYACGVDGVCRQPSGTFAYPATVVDYAAASFAVLDVDGDAIGDILGIADDHADIRFGSAIADLSRRFRHDTPRLTPSATVGIAATSDPEFPAAVVLPTPEGISVNVIRSELLLPLPTPALTSVQADFQAAQIACNPTGCGVLALGVRGGQLVLVLDQSELVDPCGATAVDAGGTFFQVVQSQMNDRDMVVVSTPATGACLYAVEGDFRAGSAGLQPRASVPAAGGVAMMPIDYDTDPCGEVALADVSGYRILDVSGCTGPGLLSEIVLSAFSRPIAAGPLDDVPPDDVVMQDHVDFNPGARFDFPVGMVLTAATVVDVNRDGLGDVVGIDTGSRLRVFIGVGGEELQLREHELDLGLASISGADLDGDTYGDVVVAAKTPELIVMFGGPSGLGPPAVFGFVSESTPIVASSRNVDARLRADVLVLETESSGRAVVDFHATANRALAPLTPQPFGPVLATMIRGVVDGAPLDQTDVAVFGITAQALQALIVPDAGGLFTTGDPYLVDLVPPMGYFAGSYGIAVERVVVGGRPAIIAMPRREGTDARTALVARIPDAAPAVIDVAPIVLIPPGAPCRARAPLHLRPVQLDADPDDELAIVVEEVCAEDKICGSCVDGPDYRIFVHDLDANGAPAGDPIDLADPARYPLPPGVRLACTDVAAIDLGLDPGLDELVASCALIGADGLVATGLVRAHGGLALDILGSPVNAPYVGIVAAGDVTGDGLDDVVIHDSAGKLGVAVQCPRHATEGCQ